MPALPAHVARTFAALVITDAPLVPRQLDRLAGRAVLGLSRMGLYDSTTGEGLVLAQSTTVRANTDATPLDGEGVVAGVDIAGEDSLPGLFQAAAEACEEAALNGLLGAAGAGPGALRSGEPLPLLPVEGWPGARRILGAAGG